jgi:ketosteroid isomerase-like protein
MGRKLQLVVLAALCVASCGPGGGTRPWRSALDDVVAAERAFAQLASDSTVQFAFMSWLAPDGILFRPGPTQGLAWLEANPMPADMRLEWEPAFADVSIDGTVGYTTGPWRSGRRGDGRTDGGAGQYVTLWRLSGDGYLAVLDFGTGNDSPAATPALELSPGPDPMILPGDPASATESVRIADEDLGEALAASGGPVWQVYSHPSARWLRDGTGPALGVASAPNEWGREFRTLGADAAGSGDLAWTWGEWTPAGEERREPVGYYLRIWKRQSDGSWSVVLDAVSRSR